MASLAWALVSPGLMMTETLDDGIYYTSRTIGFGVMGASRYRLTQWHGGEKLRTEITETPYGLADQWESERETTT